MLISGAFRALIEDGVDIMLFPAYSPFPTSNYFGGDHLRDGRQTKCHAMMICHERGRVITLYDEPGA